MAGVGLSLDMFDSRMIAQFHLICTMPHICSTIEAGEGMTLPLASYSGRLRATPPSVVSITRVGVLHRSVRLDCYVSRIQHSGSRGGGTSCHRNYVLPLRT